MIYRNILDSTIQGSRLASRIVALLLGASILFAARISALQAFADFLASRSLEGLQRATQLAPANAAFWEASALQLPIVSPEYSRDLENALRHDSHNSRLWMKLGDAAAASGDFHKAEASYLKAAEFNHGYDSHWLLANLYFRSGDTSKFWIQMREALTFDSRDLGAAFELCWAVTRNPGEILNAIPKTPRILARYLEFLIGANRMNDAATVANLLLSAPTGPRREEAPVLLSYCDRLLEAKRYKDASQIWTAMTRQSLVSGSAGASNVLVNGGMLEPFTGRGFDWRWEAPGNVGHIQIPSLNQAEFQFDGNQPENCNLLTQNLALVSGGAYRFTFDYRSLDITGHSGLRWKLTDVDTGEIQVSEEMASLGWKGSVMLFRVPPLSKGQRLVLYYERPRGTTRISGSLAVRTLVLRKVD